MGYFEVVCMAIYDEPIVVLGPSAKHANTQLISTSNMYVEEPQECYTDMRLLPLDEVFR